MKKTAVLLGRIGASITFIASGYFLYEAITIFYEILVNYGLDMNWVIKALINCGVFIGLLISGILTSVATDKVNYATSKEEIVKWGVILFIFSFLVPGILIFVSNDSDFSKKAKLSKNNKELQNIELLKKYKKLLDEDIISKEEFEDKKKNLL